MPTAQYVVQAHDIRVTKEFPTPKRMADMDAWYKAARKAIDMVPLVHQANSLGWHITHQTATLDTILFELQNRYGERASLVIYRNSVQF